VHAALRSAGGGWPPCAVFSPRLNASTLFAGDLTAPFAAARTAWPEGGDFNWLTVVVDRPAAEVRAALAGTPRVHLLLVNAPNECVIGGDSYQPGDVVRRLRCEGAAIHHPAPVHVPAGRLPAA